MVSGSDAVSGVVEGAGETPAVSCGSGAGVAALSGLRSGSPGATLAFWTGVLTFVLTDLALVGALTVAARTDFATGERWVFASASTGGRRATETSNDKMRALMRFISSVGFPVTTWYAVRTSPEPGSRDEDGTIICLN